MFLRPIDALLPLFFWSTRNPFRFIFALVIFGMITSFPNLLARMVQVTPEGTVKSAYSSLERGNGEEALKKFDKAESISGVTPASTARIHLGRAVAYQRDLEIIKVAKPILVGQSPNPKQTENEIGGKEKLLRQMALQELDKAQVASRKAGLPSECLAVMVGAKAKIRAAQVGYWSKMLEDSRTCLK